MNCRNMALYTKTVRDDTLICLNMKSTLQSYDLLFWRDIFTVCNTYGKQHYLASGDTKQFFGIDLQKGEYMLSSVH